MNRLVHAAFGAALMVTACSQDAAEEVGSAEDAVSTLGAITDGETRRFETRPNCSLERCTLTFFGMENDYADVSVITDSIFTNRLKLIAPDGSTIAENTYASPDNYDLARVRVLLRQTGTYKIDFLQPSAHGSVTYRRNAEPSENVFQEASCVGPVLDQSIGKGVLDNAATNTKTIGTFHYAIARECPNDTSIFFHACDLDFDDVTFGVEDRRISFVRQALTVPADGEVLLQRDSTDGDVSVVLRGEAGLGRYATGRTMDGTLVGDRLITGRIVASFKLDALDAGVDRRIPRYAGTTAKVEWSSDTAPGIVESNELFSTERLVPGFTRQTSRSNLSGNITTSCLRLTNQESGVLFSKLAL